MHRKWAIAVAAVVAGAGLLAGCYETPDITLHQPGEYKGPKDPLLNQQASSRDEALKKRFEVAATDR